jgi:hypothetical protein
VFGIAVTFQNNSVGGLPLKMILRARTQSAASSRKDSRWRDEKGAPMIAIADKTEKTLVKTGDAEPYGLLRSERLMTKD